MGDSSICCNSSKRTHKAAVLVAPVGKVREGDVSEALCGGVPKHRRRWLPSGLGNHWAVVRVEHCLQVRDLFEQ